MAGTRGGVGRIIAMAIGLVAVLALVLVDSARAGTYAVAQCGWGVGAEVDPTEPVRGDGYSVHWDSCVPPGGGTSGLRLEAARRIPGPGFARARWVAPPGTEFLTIEASWEGMLEKHFRQMLGIDVGERFESLITETDYWRRVPVVAEIPGDVSAVELRLDCPDEDRCAAQGPSTTVVGPLTLTLSDATRPTARPGGALVVSGWHRGTVPLELAAEDTGAGVAHEDAEIDGNALLSVDAECAVVAVEGETRGTNLQPCPAAVSRTVEVDTMRLVDGAHGLHDCAADFAGNVGCGDVTFKVDNSAPVVAFDDAPEGQVVATVSDPASGPASGSIALRRAESDAWLELRTQFRAVGAGQATLTASLPKLDAGTYVVRAVAGDAVGNLGSSSRQVSGTAAQISRRLAGGKGRHPSRSRRRRATHLTASLQRDDGARGRRGRSSPGPRSELTVDYGTTVRLQGRLTGRRGAGIGGRPVEVIVLPARGARAPRSVHRILTDRYGAFELDLPAGPSRHLVVSFHGGHGLAPAARRELDLGVRAAVSLTAMPRALHTGETVRLRGQVRHGAARIPGRGKLVAIQYFERDSGHWRPALVVRTDASGRFDERYRFRYITGAARIRLRATALPEQDWPYASGSSSPVTVRVSGG